MKSKRWTALRNEFLVYAGLLFVPAGTLAWPAAWAFLVLFFGARLLITRALARDDPDLFEERKKPIIQKGQPLWDKIILVTIVVLLGGGLILMGLDAGRFHWSAVPAELQWLGAGGVLTSTWIAAQVFRANPFLATVVRVQTERSHAVVTSGPYGVVRHPLYAANLLLFPSAALMLGSRLGLVPMILLAGVYILRTALEDRELHGKLDGYADYARRVRYRLIPLVW
ncbi:MAG TPA: isoprenylcysteine carboxylmethyltransferase family protein [Methylocella sp.]|jgi:protein-S-isoprenylcysteine O-methyltransferase Ste14|nr:isoprenylcysteine carboxylmethyltransferase family protein [Methylocella sp.]